MRTTIHFWHVEKGLENNILTIYDDAIDSFKIGDKLYFDFEEYYPKTISDLKKQYKESFVESFLEDYKLNIKTYNNERFKIVSKYISVKKDANFNNDNVRVSIEYYCKLFPKFYWNWWYIKNLIKKFLQIQKS